MIIWKIKNNGSQVHRSGCRRVCRHPEISNHQWLGSRDIDRLMQLLYLMQILVSCVIVTIAKDLFYEQKPCVVICRTGMCLYENCSNAPQCPGGSCLFKRCKNAGCSGGACTFRECSGGKSTCDGGGCKFHDHYDTLSKGYCDGEGCTYNGRHHPTFLGGHLTA